MAQIRWAPCSNDGIDTQSFPEMSTTAPDASLKMYESDLGKDVQKSRTTPVDEEKAFGSQIQMSTESGWSESPENPLNWPSGRKWASVGGCFSNLLSRPLLDAQLNALAFRSVVLPGLYIVNIPNQNQL